MLVTSGSVEGQDVTRCLKRLFIVRV